MFTGDSIGKGTNSIGTGPFNGEEDSVGRGGEGGLKLIGEGSDVNEGLEDKLMDGVVDGILPGDSLGTEATGVGTFTCTGELTGDMGTLGDGIIDEQLQSNGNVPGNPSIE